MEDLLDLDPDRCPRCNRPQPIGHARSKCWCEDCYPVVTAELHEHCNKPALCVGTPEYARYDCQPDPEVVAALIAERSRKTKRRVRLVSKSVPDAPVLEYDL